MEKENRPASENKFEDHCAAVLIGLPVNDLRRLAKQSGLGRTEQNSGNEQLVFTYPELLQLSRMAARGHD
jgi:hypothetical protein